LGPAYKSVLADRRVVRVAVNLEYVGPEHPIAVGDEVALFPPVTGG
ncbi:MAG TPA: MoaD/ThiS family protein, partial [Dongiaceae bacterium]